MAVNPDHREFNAAAAVADETSVFHHYRRLIALRHSEPVVVHGDFTMLLADHPRVYAFTRCYEGTELFVLVNVSSLSVDVDLEDGWDATELLLGTHPGGRPGSLRPWEARIHRRAA